MFRQYRLNAVLVVTCTRCGQEHRGNDVTSRAFKLERALAWYRTRAKQDGDLAARCRRLRQSRPWAGYPRTRAELDRDAALWASLADELDAYLAGALEDRVPLPDAPLF